MFPLFRILVFILKGLPLAVTNPFFWTVLLIIWLQYRKSADLEERMFGVVKVSPGKKVLYAVFFGILGGIVGSFVIVFLGISITEAGLIYVWPLAIILMLIHPHLMCFSYAGGIVSLFSLLFGYPRIDVAGLMALVGVLHMVESLLIYTAGHLNSAPVFIQDKKYGIVGGFSLQEFWPVPIMMLAVMLGQVPTQDIINMPAWWPIIKPPAEILGRKDLVYLMMPVVAALGYGDIALTRPPRARSRASALNLLIFSVVLLLLAIMASRIHAFKYIAALFAPIAHEALIIMGRKNERERPPLFTPPTRGVRVLDVLKDSPAEKMGIEPGDIILSINGRQVEDSEDIRLIKTMMPTYIWLDVLKTDGSFKTMEMNTYLDGVSILGVLLVPKSQDVPFVVMEEKGLLEGLKRFFRKRNG
ncbi:PDZ domain-containing protein [Thermosediminibacter oceani]|uniref:PDZ/DHR/GLGF domain protein n=1 Tax=Thermosediminibacter oceani (strain ATCC BAA-1034 / DSM 16646 / JW/IW-1228P) TaxID=555079 RepID=D9RYJ9_THEOJ|nr:PDZ domain-containing protein [Thermosediminibacter oceani]ADL08423.1 PDZ/DHR/GLGF domain protein [Thermosediminibacter oceani DSM 16646]